MMGQEQSKELGLGQGLEGGVGATAAALGKGGKRGGGRNLEGCPAPKWSQV